MTTSRRYRLIEIEWPTFGEGTPPPQASVAEFEGRLDAVRAAMDKLGLTHLVVYGDREHFANLTWLTGFDPRFEEAILIVGLQDAPLLVVGNECEGYLSVSPLYEAGKLRSERFQPFSLLDQPRDDSRLIGEIFADEGIERGSMVGCVGWKYFAESEHPDAAHAIELPAYPCRYVARIGGRRTCDKRHGGSDASRHGPADLLLAGRDCLFRIHQRRGVRGPQAHAVRHARRDDRPRIGATGGLQRSAAGLSHDPRQR